MEIKNLKTKEFIAHLRRHPMPELMDEECSAALAAVEAQYGDRITCVTMLEVRLGEEARHADFILSLEEKNIPRVPGLWYEIDYEEYKQAADCCREIKPCLFVNVSAAQNKDATFWDDVLPPFLGEARAKRLRSPLDRVIGLLPEGAYFKQIGTMSSRGELDIMRLVILFPSWESIFSGLADIGWSGDVAALCAALEPWRETQSIAVNIDLGAEGVLPKIGIEIFSRWRNPLIVDKLIARLENARLCLPSKGAALRRWIRILPDGDPFIQTILSHFKLNYRDGHIVEAKAYLEQDNIRKHTYFRAYDRPLLMEMELKNSKHSLPVGTALQWIYECEVNRVRRVHFRGDVTSYEHLDRLLGMCKDSGIISTVALSTTAAKAWLKDTLAAGANEFLLEVDANKADVLSVLQELNCSARIKWRMNSKNVGELPQAVRHAEKFGAQEFIISGPSPNEFAEKFPDESQMEQAAKFFREFARSVDINAAVFLAPLTNEQEFVPWQKIFERRKKSLRTLLSAEEFSPLLDEDFVSAWAERRGSEVLVIIGEFFDLFSDIFFASFKVWTPSRFGTSL